MGLIKMAPYILLALALAYGGLLFMSNRDLSRRLNAAERDLVIAEQAMDQVREADKVNRAHLNRLALENKIYQADLLALQDLEGYDAPLSDFLRAADRRLH